jgi:hypothetical protein
MNGKVTSLLKRKRVFVLRMHESRIVDTINMDHEGVCLYCVRTEHDFYVDIDPIVFLQ